MCISHKNKLINIDNMQMTNCRRNTRSRLYDKANNNNRPEWLFLVDTVYSFHKQSRQLQRQGLKNCSRPFFPVNKKQLTK